MPSLSQKLAVLLKPLRLEIRQGFTNRSVSGGLDRYMMDRLDEILSVLPAVQKEPIIFFKKLKSDFSQYMTLQGPERREFIKRSGVELKGWMERFSKGAGDDKASLEKLSIDNPVIPFVPREKTKAFHFTKLKTVEDLLRYSPKWAIHQSLLTPIAQCVNREEPYFIKARINGVSANRRGRLETLKVNLEDGSGHLTWVWFNRPYLKKELLNGRWVLLHDTPRVSKWGKQVTGRGESFEFLTPEEEKDLGAGKVLVFYPSTPTLTQAFWREIVGKVLDQYSPCLPAADVRDSVFAKISQGGAIQGIHHPGSLVLFEQCRKRLAFDELLILQLFLIMKRREIERREKGRQYQFEGDGVLKFRKTIPYELTQAQKKVIKEIRTDLVKPYPMNRLLQGDVGSGKTLVAAICSLYAADSGTQSAFMAPTEILSLQHYQNLKKLLEPVGLKIEVLTSDMKAKVKRAALESIRSGQVDLVVGTHALLEEGVKFKNLGFVVIDERHKFGVLQRAALEAKGKWPDCLMMTATPFPRALVLTEYGDTDLSLLDEFPKGRKSVKTFWKSDGKKEEVYQFAKERILKGEQVFWVFPVVDESKNFLKSAIQMYQYFQREVFHGFKVGLLHGKMKKEEKEEAMRGFVNKKIQILVATTVVEVGVDVANATLMVIEHAERFGLAQLHQLRGRVGRGTEQSYCYLITSPLLSNDAVERMKIMVSTLDGFKLSEFDLMMRGPGEIFGVAQSGHREGGIVDLKKDIDVVEDARKIAQIILKDDPKLRDDKNQNLRKGLKTKYQNLLDLAQIS